MPAKFADRAPRVVDRRRTAARRGSTTGKRQPQGRAQRGRRSPDRGVQLRAGALRRDAPRRVGHRRPRADMDLNGVYASLCFPSFLPGFAGQRLQLGVSDPELALGVRARVRTTGTSRSGPARTPTASSRARSRGCSTPRSRPTRSARNAARGFKAVTFPENPEQLGLPSLHTGYWDPFLAACEETEHGRVPARRVVGRLADHVDDAPADSIGVLFFGYAMFAAVDWLYSKIPVRFPNIKICLSEGGIGWVAGPARPARPRRQVPGDLRHVGGHRPHAARGAAAQLLVLRDRRPVGVRRARPHRRRPHPASRPTTRTPTPPGPTPRRSCGARSGTCRVPTAREDHVAQRRGAVPPPGARAVVADPESVVSGGG